MLPGAKSGTRALEEPERALLGAGRFFSRLDARQLDRLAGVGRLLAFPQDTRIYTIGDEVDDFYVLAEGTVRFTLGLGKRETAAGDIIRRGDVFGWAALVEGYSRRIATAYCLTACEVVALDGAALRAFMDSDPLAGYLVMKQLAVLLTSELTAFAAG
ncbi:MAG: cyclic nucleotide-binding domain-containing protein [Usitatibacter sp.]